jgi:signal transduction histidine kinase/CheY-like chemotaxis protein
VAKIGIDQGGLAMHARLRSRDGGRCWLRWRRALAAAGLVAAALALGAGWPLAAAAQTDGAAADTTGPVWRYGMLADYPPFQVWPDGGLPGGADLALLGAAAAQAGGRIEARRYTDFGALMDDLAAGRIDVASAMARTPERERQLAFGPAYARIEQVMVTRSRDGDVPLSPDLAGRRVAVVDGYASANAVARLFPLAPRVPVADVAEGLRALGEGRADLFFESARVVAETLDRLQLPDLRVARSVVLDSGDLHLASGLAAAARLAPLAAALDARGAAERQAVVARWSAAAPLPLPQALVLSAEEQRALAALAPLRVAVVGAQAPFSFADPQGRAAGLSVDLLAATLKRLGLPTPTWQVLDAAAAGAALRAGDADLALGLPELAARGWGTGHVGPFIEHPLMLVAPRGSGLWSLEQLHGRRLAMPALQVPQTLLHALHPRIEAVDCASVVACLRLVQGGQAQAMVADVVSLALVLGSGGFDDLQFVGTAGDLRHARGVAVSPAQRPLVPLLQRALDVAVAEDLPAIKARWLERPPPQRVLAGLVRRFGPGLLAAVLLLGALWWWHRRGLHAEVARTQAARRQAERAADSARRFVVFLAHEVRNSLHSVIAAGELLRGQPGVDARVAEPLGRSARATLVLLNGLLDRERLAAGALTLNPAPVRLPALVAAVVDEMTPLARAAGATLVMDPLPDRLLRVDALRVQQVLRNLLANAFKYGGPGVVAVEHEVAAHAGGCRVRLRVRDHGPGMDARALALAFEPYASAHPGRPDSAGLGLSLSRDLARALGGDLTLAQADGGGLSAEFCWQAECLQPRADAPSEPPGRRVLIVEDAEVYALLLRRAFEDAGWHVETVATVADARVRLAAQPFALLLSDLHLPDGDAAAVLAATDRPGLRRVVMSADLEADMPALPGADHVVAKEADVALFVAKVLLLEGEGQAAAV